ncbi:type II secretion system protein GspG [Candidatus Dependentiae bacterium]|nr:type II secretion system protein GspG [Candidatus Dependentiae bacterium]
MSYCSKHTSSTSIGRCGDCGRNICGQCRRYYNGTMYCKECNERIWYKNNKQFKDKLKYGKYKYSSAPEKSTLLSNFLQLLIIGISGLIIYKLGLKYNILPENLGGTMKNTISKIQNFNPNDMYNEKLTKTKLKSFKRIFEIYRTDNGKYPSDFNSFINEMFEEDQRELNKKDAWGNDFVYKVDNSKDIYTVISKGPDNRLDTEDDIQVSNKKKK